MGAEQARTQFDALLDEAAAYRRPPIHAWHPSEEIPFDMRIAADGSWYHEGAPITRPELVRLFASILRCEEGQHWLITPHQRAPVRVDDVAFTVIGAEHRDTPEGGDILLSTNVGDHFIAGAEHPIEMRETPRGRVPYVFVRDGLYARIGQNTYYWLIAHHLAERDGRRGVVSRGRFFDLE